MANAFPAQVTQTFTSTLATPAAARHFVGRALVGLDDREVDAAVLLTSELVSNSVQHAKTDWVQVAVDIEPGGAVRIAVNDADPVLPHLESNVTANDERGRGLAIVDQLTESWGTARLRSQGKTTWFRLTP